MRRYQLKRLLPRHYRVLELVLLGKRRKEIAAAVGMTPRNVTNVTGSRVFQEALQERRREQNLLCDGAIAEEAARLQRLIVQAGLQAAATEVELLKSPDPRVRLRAASEILDRAGLTVCDIF